jgi:hypothetical protein
MLHFYSRLRKDVLKASFLMFEKDTLILYRVFNQIVSVVILFIIMLL